MAPDHEKKGARCRSFGESSGPASHSFRHVRRRPAPGQMSSGKYECAGIKVSFTKIRGRRSVDGVDAFQANNASSQEQLRILLLDAFLFFFRAATTTSTHPAASSKREKGVGAVNRNGVATPSSRWRFQATRRSRWSNITEATAPATSATATATATATANADIRQFGRPSTSAGRPSVTARSQVLDFADVSLAPLGLRRRSRRGRVATIGPRGDRARPHVASLLSCQAARDD